LLVFTFSQITSEPVGPDDESEDLVEVQFVQTKGSSGVGILEVLNRSTERMVAYVTGCADRGSGNLRFTSRDGSGTPLAVGAACVPGGGGIPGGMRGDAGDSGTIGDSGFPPKMVPIDCVTFVTVLSPGKAVQLARVELAPWAADGAWLSHTAFKFDEHPDPNGAISRVFPHFPLGAASGGEDGGGGGSGGGDIGPFLCTQGCGGGLTHFFKESHHAIDLQCPIGTVSRFLQLALQCALPVVFVPVVFVNLRSFASFLSARRFEKCRHTLICQHNFLLPSVLFVGMPTFMAPFLTKMACVPV
jgi:hypothetical protein